MSPLIPDRNRTAFVLSRIPGRHWNRNDKTKKISWHAIAVGLALASCSAEPTANDSQHPPASQVAQKSAQPAVLPTAIDTTSSKDAAVGIQPANKSAHVKPSDDAGTISPTTDPTKPSVKIADASVDAHQPTPPAVDRNTGPPKNIKVLPKKWSRERITSYMKRTISRGLGVKCAFCHNESDYAADGSSKKRIARDMLRMSRAVNKGFFKGKRKVTCYSCHRGRKKP